MYLSIYVGRKRLGELEKNTLARENEAVLNLAFPPALFWVWLGEGARVSDG